MARSCTICTLPPKRLLAIDRAILQRQMLKALAAKFEVSVHAVGRHKKHMQTAMVKAAGAAERQQLEYGTGLLGELESITNDVQRLQLELEAGQDRKGALKAIHERLSALELKAKLTGSLESGGRNVTVVQQGLTFEQAVQLAREIIEAAGMRVIEGECRELPQLPVSAEMAQEAEPA